jgi:hypothetical protein
MRMLSVASGDYFTKRNPSLPNRPDFIYSL